MGVKKEDTDRDWVDPDEIPDLSTDKWARVIDATSARRGRPKASVTKVSTTIRLDRDVVDAFKASGGGWQSRMNAALRKAAGLG